MYMLIKPLIAQHVVEVEGCTCNIHVHVRMTRIGNTTSSFFCYHMLQWLMWSTSHLKGPSIPVAYLPMPLSLWPTFQCLHPCGLPSNASIPVAYLPMPLSLWPTSIPVAYLPMPLSQWPTFQCLYPSGLPSNASIPVAYHPMPLSRWPTFQRLYPCGLPSNASIPVACDRRSS